jgi:hypothetical protein
VIEAIPEPLRILIALGLTMLLVLLRLEAERFRAAEYDEPDDAGQSSLAKRLAWYAIGAVLIGGVLLFHPAPAADLYLGAGSRGSTILMGMLYGIAAAIQAVVYSRYRYGRVRLPDVGAYPGALLNQIATAFLDEAAFRGALLGFLVFAGLNPLVAVVIQALTYTLATRLGAPGRDPYMFALALGAGFLGGWVTIVTGGFAAAFIGHAVMRISVFLVTGHAGHPAPRGRETEEIERRRRPPEGWRVIPTRGPSRGPTRER